MERTWNELGTNMACAALGEGIIEKGEVTFAYMAEGAAWGGKPPMFFLPFAF